MGCSDEDAATAAQQQSVGNHGGFFMLAFGVVLGAAGLAAYQRGRNKGAKA